MNHISEPEAWDEEPHLSASQCLSNQLRQGFSEDVRELSDQQAKTLEDQSYCVVPDLFQGLAGFQRPVLMEYVRGAATSLLSQAVQERAKRTDAAIVCGPWDSCDLSNQDGLRLFLDRVRLERPQHVWLNPRSEPYSPLTNIHQRTESQKDRLQASRREALKEYVACTCVMHACIQQGCHVSIMLPDRCQAWRLPLFAKIRDKYGLFSGTTRGCAVNLRHPKDHRLMQQGWKVLTTQRRLAEVLDLRCACSKEYKHGCCSGHVDRPGNHYTKEFAHRAARALVQELSHEATLKECQGDTCLVTYFGDGEFCTCGEISLPHVPQPCTSCLKGRGQVQATGATPAQARTRAGQVLCASEVTNSGIGWVQAGQVTPAQVEPQVDPRLRISELEVVDTSGDACVVGAVGQELFTQEETQTVERRAQSLLEARNFTHKACENLIASLPQHVRSQHRGAILDERARYLTFGLYAYGNHYGVTKCTLQFPRVCRYILRYLQHWSKDKITCTSFVINDNGTLKMHKDHHNKEGCPNFLIGVSSYQHGGLWIEGPPENSRQKTRAKVLPNGETRLGHILDTRHQMVSFNAKQWHATEAWQGNRVVVSAFVSRGWDVVNSELQGLLRDLDFPVPERTLVQHPELSPLPVEDKAEDEAFVIKTRGPWSGPLKQQGVKEHERIKKQLYLLHAATGHGSVRHMVDALKRRNADPLVLQLARDFKCSICQERARVQPRQVASLEPLPQKYHTVSADMGHWTHPKTGEPQNFMVVIDEGSRFRIARILTKGHKATPSGAECMHYLMEGWIQIFGKPRTLRLDPAGNFRGQDVVSFCDRHSIYLDNIPGEAHWQIGATEQAVQGIKQVMSKLASSDPDMSAEECLSLAVNTFNQRELVRGFSPVQHVLGQSPDATGRLIRDLSGLSEEPILNKSPEDFRREEMRRAEAEKALADWQAQQRVTKAMNSRTRPLHHYQPGDLVYFWRTQESNKNKRQSGMNQGRILGPARVLAMETRKGPEGELRASHSIWCVRGRQLIKCSPEQLRPASMREELVEALSPDQQTPWTYQRLVKEIGGNQYQDVSSEVPSETEWHRAQDPAQEAPPTRRRRITYKRPSPEAGDESMDDLFLDEASQEISASSRRPRGKQNASLLQGHCWWTEVKEKHWSSHQSSFWSDTQAAVEVEIPLPEQRKQMDKVSRDLQSYFVGALKRKAVEVSERKLSPQDREKFKAAKMIEVKNFLAAEAFEALPEGLRPSREQAVGMRWVLTWKTQDNGQLKAKARAVLLGYQDPGYEHRATTAPVMTRQTRQLLLQLAANERWHIMKGDVSGAFLQGRSYPDELYCVPCPEICAEMGLPPETITRLKKACYGLVDAPLEWYKTVATFFDSLGLERLWSDACAWVWRVNGRVRGMISGHVDDFIFAGSQHDKEWQALLTQIRERFKWGDWDADRFTQCGVHVETVPEGFAISQPKYLESIEEIHVNATRRKQRDADTTDREKTQLRGLLGALSWHSQQVAPHIAADVSMLLSEVSKSTVETIFKANALLHHAKVRSEHKMMIHRCADEMVFLAWVDAGSQNRADGSSTQGIVIGAASTGLLRGEVEPISFISWHSNKIDRACRSPGAAETQAAVNGEDALYYARYQWSEMLYGRIDTRDPDQAVAKVPGCLVTDSRNVYDKLTCEVVSIKGAEKRTNIEALALKESQNNTGLVIRWVHSEAQLANSLTKKGGKNEIEMFYRMRQRWRIVEDANMKSARKRREEGLDPLAQTEKQIPDNTLSSSVGVAGVGGHASETLE